MKILYGVVGEGMGHAIRSRVVIAELLARGHEVEVIASQRAVDFLSARFENVHRIHGYHIVYEENRVRIGRTVWSNVLAGARALPQQIAAYFELVEDYRPEVVISDFESWTYLYGKTHDLPVISVDNMQIIHRCTHAPEILEDQRANFELAKAFIKTKLPFCQHYIIGTFFYPPVRKSDTTLVPPILRSEVVEQQPTRGDHLLVYQTAERHEALTEALARTGMECRIYGMRRGIEAEQVEGTLRYRPFSEAAFVADLASARGVVAGGGFTLMSECVYLNKPMLSVPVGGQFEQVINGRYLEREGFGKTAPEVNEEVLRGFIDAVPKCEENLARYQQDENRLMLDALEHQLDCAAAGLP